MYSFISFGKHWAAVLARAAARFQPEVKETVEVALDHEAMKHPRPDRMAVDRIGRQLALDRAAARF